MSETVELSHEALETIGHYVRRVDKRFDELHRSSTRWFTAITVMLGIIGLAVSISGFVR